MMASATSRRSGLLLVIIAGAAVLAALHFGPPGATHDGARAVPDSSALEGWKTIEYRGVRVDIPQGWERSDMEDCEFRFEHWGPPDPRACGDEGGVAFYSSATFDPARGPGLRRTQAHGVDAGPWSGWTPASGELVVYASGQDRGVIGDLLASVRRG
jgi:hypothetical protein